uniref:Uncharacterized protein n=1 Tax=Parascaris univalens TaxID=6257 RepID=A0A915A4F6_PARUN
MVFHIYAGLENLIHRSAWFLMRASLRLHIYMSVRQSQQRVMEIALNELVYLFCLGAPASDNILGT